MAGKKKTTTAIAAAALCLVLLIVAPVQQVSADSKFCRCYKQCFPACRKSLPRWLCIAKCADDCSPNAHSATAGTGWCESVCSLSFTICGMSDAAAYEDADAGEAGCVRDCVREGKNRVSII